LQQFFLPEQRNVFLALEFFQTLDETHLLVTKALVKNWVNEPEISILLVLSAEMNSMAVLWIS
jgi:hypothetical protein